jgi:hypothetical protein
MNLSVARRPLYVILLASGLALIFVMATVDVASARHTPATRRFSTAAFEPDFQATAPDRFRCRFDDSANVHGYVCRAGARTFLLSDALQRGGNPPPGEGFEGLATPDRFRCRWDGNAAGDRSAEHYICKYRHRHGSKGRKHTHTFRANEIVSVTDIPNPDEAQEEDDLWVLPHPATQHACPRAR